MSRVAGIFMALVLSVGCYALENVSDSARVKVPSSPEQKADTNRKEKSEDYRSCTYNAIVYPAPITSADGWRGISTNGWTAIGTIVIGAFTIALFITSLLQWRAIKKANEVARDAADATKRSVDAYIGRERGRLVLEYCHKPEPNTLKMEFAFRNSGPTEMLVTGFGAIPVVHDTKGPFQIPEIPVAVASQVVKPNELFAGDIRSNQLVFGIPGSIRIAPEMSARLSEESNTRLLAAFRVNYRTAMGPYVMQSVYVLERFGPLSVGSDLCFDLPWHEWEQRQKKEE